MRRVLFVFSMLFALLAITGCDNMSANVKVKDSKGSGTMTIDVRIAKTNFTGDNPLFRMDSQTIANKLTKDSPTDKMKVSCDSRSDKNYEIIHFTFTYNSIKEFNNIMDKLDKSNEKKIENLVLSEYGDTFLTVLGINDEESDENSSNEQDDSFIAKSSIKAEGTKADDKITLSMSLEQISSVLTWYAIDLVEYPDDVFNMNKATFLQDAFETDEKIDFNTELDEETLDKMVDGEIEVVFGSKSSGRIKLSTYKDEYINVSTILSDVQKMNDVVKIEDDDVPLIAQTADDDSPKTADLSSAFLATALCFSTAATIVVLMKKKKESQI